MTTDEDDHDEGPSGLPDGLRHVRTTDELTAVTTPPGLRQAHRLATGVWGVLRVRAGQVAFTFEEDGPHGPAGTTAVLAGGHQVIPPDTPHHVEPDADARFVIEFHRPADEGPGAPAR